MLNQEWILYATGSKYRTAGCKLKVSEAKTRFLRNEGAPIFACKAATKGFAELRRRDTRMSMPHFPRPQIGLGPAKATSTTRQAMKVNATETVKPVGITNFRAVLRRICAPRRSGTLSR